MTEVGRIPGSTSEPDPQSGTLKPWHWYSITLALMVVVPLLWFVLAYGGLPRLWSHHEHKKIGTRDQIQSYTAQDIPGDPVNLHLKGSQAAITCAFRHAGWFVADPVSLRSGLEIGSSVLLHRPYPQAPVSPLYVQDQMQTIAFEKAQGKSADKRHHVRIWQVGQEDWLGAATFDRGVGFSLFTFQITHHIAPDVDRERDDAGTLLMANGAVPGASESSRIVPGQWHRNGGGDHYRTDGQIKVYALAARGC
jgi:hypothetical protein